MSEHKAALKATLVPLEPVLQGLRMAAHRAAVNAEQEYTQADMHARPYSDRTKMQAHTDLGDRWRERANMLRDFANTVRECGCDAAVTAQQRVDLAKEAQDLIAEGLL